MAPPALRLALVGLALATLTAAHAGDDRLLPTPLPKDQRTNLLQFLKDHQTPDRYVPNGAKLIDDPPPADDAKVTATKDKPIKQYTVQVMMHRPVPGAEAVTKADVLYYRPSPTKGKQGITVKYTVDLTTGKQVGETEVLTKMHTPISRDEVDEAVALVKDRSEAVKKLYEGREAGAVRWEYLQMKVNRRTTDLDPGDRVLRFVFTADPAEKEKPPAPVRVIVNLTKDKLIPEAR